MFYRNLGMVLLCLLLSIGSIQSQVNIQLIHNSPDQSLATVDVWANGTTQLADDLDFRDATAYISVPAGTYFVTINDASSTDSSNSVYASGPLNLMNGLNYTVIVEGTTSAGYTPAQPLDLEIFGGAQLTAADPSSVDLWIYHGSTDAPSVDLYDLQADESVQILNNLSYSGNSGNYLSLAATNRSVQVRDQSAIVLGQYAAPFSSFAGQALTVLASGFVNPAQNNNGAPFTLIAVDTAGNVIPLPTEPISPARLQLIHNCAAPAAATVDVWLGGSSPFVDNFNFRTQTDFFDAPAGQSIRVHIADSSSQDTVGSLFQKDFVLESNETYIVIASGTIGGSFSPAIPFDLIPIKGREQSSSAVAVDVQAFHGATDAPEIDLLETSVPVGIIEDSFAYAEVTPYISLPVAEYVIELRTSSGGNLIGNYDADLAPFTGEAITILASGFVDPSANENGASFGLWVANGSAGPLVELGTTVSTEETVLPQARLFPNPTLGSSTLSLGRPLDSPLRWQVVDALGRVVLEQELPAGQEQFRLPLEKVSPGIYFLRLEVAGKLKTFKLQKQ